MTFEQQLDLVLFELKEILLKKNADYGSSFAEQFKEYGLTSYLIRDDDKTRRLKNLLKNKNQVNESKRDSVLDKAGYAVLGLICLGQEQTYQSQAKDTLKTTDDWMALEHLKSMQIKPKKPPYFDLDDQH